MNANQDEGEDIVSAVLDKLSEYSGFDAWWSSLDSETRQEIIRGLWVELKSRL